MSNYQKHELLAESPETLSFAIVIHTAVKFKI
jgi:hypothetical protein